MLLPYTWLQEFLDLTLSPHDTADLLTLLGLEVEAQEEVSGSPVFDIKVTPNRGDCLSAIGIARELSASLQLLLRLPEPQMIEGGMPVGQCAAVEISAPDLCPRYSARVIRNVKLGPSPGWLQQRLIQCGVRPINNAVDVTNLVMLELGQPLHAFDAELVHAKPGGDVPTIIVRRANPGEKMTTLDGEERALTPEMLVIADGTRAVALAGVMGGSNSEINDRTKTILLESAHFNPLSIRRTSKALGLSSEASYRFERRVDPDVTVTAVNRAAALIAELSGGEVAPGVIDVQPEPYQPVVLQVRVERVNRLLGTSLTAEEMATYLRRLLMKVDVVDSAAIRMEAPSFRGDIVIEDDVAEEVARMHGYDNIAPQTVAVGDSGGRMLPSMKLEAQARRILLACGLNETVNFSLQGPDEMPMSGFAADDPLMEAVVIRNPKAEDHSRLRTSMISSMLDLLSRNWRRGLREVQAFELGRVYLPQAGEKLPDERHAIGLAMLMGPHPVGWGKERIDFYSLKGIIETLLDGIHVSDISYIPAEHPSLMPGETAAVMANGQQIGIFGRVRPSVQENWGLPKESFVGELDLEAILHLKRSDPAYDAVSRYPAVQRDLALLVPRTCAAAEVERTLREQAGEVLEQLSLFDVYEGKSLPTGTRSLAYSLTLRAGDRTLTDPEVDPIMSNIEEALRAIGVTIRS